MCLVDNDIVPSDFSQCWQTDTNSLETSNDDIEFTFVDYVAEYLLSFVSGCDEFGDSGGG